MAGRGFYWSWLPSPKKQDIWEWRDKRPWKQCCFSWWYAARRFFFLIKKKKKDITCLAWDGHSRCDPVCRRVTRRSGRAGYRCGGTPHAFTWAASTQGPWAWRAPCSRGAGLLGPRLPGSTACPGHGTCGCWPHTPWSILPRGNSAGGAYFLLIGEDV